MGASHPNDRVRDWFDRRTIGPVERDLHALISAKRRDSTSISVCLPTLNEVATVGNICRLIEAELVRPGLVDEVIVCDSGSTDGTPTAAREAGARVELASEVMPERVGFGKGVALWKSLAVSGGDIVVWLDADVVNFDTAFVMSLVGPLLEDPTVQMTKAFYRRPDAAGIPDGGGRVTETVARPLLNLFYPELAGVIQPLSGEYAMRREVAVSLPFLTGYAVDVGLLIDVCEGAGLEAIAQVDLKLRVHRNRDLAALGRMSFEVMQGMLRRFDELGRMKVGDLPGDLVQFEHGEAMVHEIQIDELPPMRDVR